VTSLKLIKMKKDKDFDAVEMMRSIRSKLQDKYEKDPNARRKRLLEIRKKFRTTTRRKVHANS
jgi:hypothetical protein